jgi:hypothetical protein
MAPIFLRQLLAWFENASNPKMDSTCFFPKSPIYLANYGFYDKISNFSHQSYEF